jgi:hypothetical protein
MRHGDTEFTGLDSVDELIDHLMTGLFFSARCAFELIVCVTGLVSLLHNSF